MILPFTKREKITLAKKTQQGLHKGKTILEMPVELYLFKQMAIDVIRGMECHKRSAANCSHNTMLFEIIHCSYS